LYDLIRSQSKLRGYAKSMLSPLLHIAYVNDIWRNNESNIRLFPGDFIIYRKIMDNRDSDILERDLNSLGDWAV